MAPHGWEEITAMFIGSDRSMGFRTGEVYKLWIMKKPNVIYISRRSMNARAIPYDTEKAVRKNWEIMQPKESEMTIQEIHEMQDRLGCTRIYLENVMKDKVMSDETKRMIIKPVEDVIKYLDAKDRERRERRRELESGIIEDKMSKVEVTLECCREPIRKQCEYCPYTKECCHDHLPSVAIKDITDIIVELAIEIGELENKVRSLKAENAEMERDRKEDALDLADKIQHIEARRTLAKTNNESPEFCRGLEFAIMSLKGEE